MSGAELDVVTNGRGDDLGPPSRWALRRPRLWGAVLLLPSAWLLVYVVNYLRNMAPPGTYGQMDLNYEAGNVTYRLVAGLGLLGVLITAAVMLLIGRPANRLALIGIAAGVIVVLGLGLTRISSVFIGGEGCFPTYSSDEVHEMWADRPTVGELLTGGVLQGNVADDAALASSLERDPSAAGCPGM